jgi:hypothetical protein
VNIGRSTMKMRPRVGITALCALSLSLLFANAGCCYTSATRTQPVRPSRVSGWRTTSYGSVVSVGDFVLGKGESTDNGKVRVSVKDIIPLECKSPLAEPLPTRVLLSFYRVSDGKRLCERAFTTGGATLSGTGINDADICGSDFEFKGIYISAISSSENWVAFDLRK